MEKTAIANLTIKRSCTLVPESQAAAYVFARFDFEYASGSGNGGSAVIYMNDSQVTLASTSLPT